MFVCVCMSICLCMLYVSVCIRVHVYVCSLECVCWGLFVCDGGVCDVTSVFMYGTRVCKCVRVCLYVMV